MGGKHTPQYNRLHQREWREKNREHFLEYRSDYRARNQEAIRTYERDRARRRRKAAKAKQAIPPGKSRALDILRQQLVGKQGYERARISAAVEHLERVIAGERVQPRGLPRPHTRGAPRVPATYGRIGSIVSPPSDPTIPTSAPRGKRRGFRIA